MVLVPNTRVSSDMLVHENHVGVGKSPSQDRVTDDLTVSLMTIECPKRCDSFELGLSNLDLYYSTSFTTLPSATAGSLAQLVRIVVAISCQSDPRTCPYLRTAAICCSPFAS